MKKTIPYAIANYEELVEDSLFCSPSRLLEGNLNLILDTILLNDLPPL